MKAIVGLACVCALLTGGAYGQREGSGGERHRGSGGGFHGGPRGPRGRAPLGFPLVWDGFYDGSADYGAAAPNVTLLYLPPAPQPPPPPSPPPPPPSPEVKEYRWNSPPTPPGKPAYFTMALTDGTTVKALAYWVDDDTLNYFDLAGKRQQTAIEKIDRARSGKLNRERGLEFGLQANE